MFIDILFLLIEEGCSNSMIRQCLRHKGMSEREINETIRSAGLGNEREYLKQYANKWSRERFNAMRK